MQHQRGVTIKYNSPSPASLLGNMIFQAIVASSAEVGNYFNPASPETQGGSTNTTLSGGNIIVMPAKGVLKNLYIQLDGEQSDIECAFGVYINGAETPLNALVDADHSIGSNNHVTMNVNQGDHVTLRLIPTFHANDAVACVSFFFQAK